MLPSQAFAVGRRSSQLRRGTPVHTPRYGIKPTVRDILATERARITVALKPRRIDHESLRQSGAAAEFSFSCFCCPMVGKIIHY